MYGQKLTREQAIKMVGLTNVENAEADNCELTCRVGGNGLMHDDPYLEYAGSASVDYDGLSKAQFDNLPIGGCSLKVYYRASNEAEQASIDADSPIWDIMTLNPDEYEIC